MGRIAGIGLTPRIKELLASSPEELRFIRQSAIEQLKANPYTLDQINQIEDVAQRNQIPVMTDPRLPPGISGRANQYIIRLSPKLDQQVFRPRILSHELGHSLLRHYDSDLAIPFQELEAESIAYGIAHKMGIPQQSNADLAATYLAKHWQPLKGTIDPEEWFMDYARPRVREVISQF